MEYGAIDLHKKESQVRIVTENGEIVDRRIATTRDRFSAVFGGRARMRILVEASTESEWVAQHLEELGHEVIVADPNYAPMYGQRSRRVKTDRRDVAALTEACRLEIYRPAHRRSAAQTVMQWHLGVRDQIVRTRTRSITLMRTAARMEGVHVRTGAAETFLLRLDQAALTPAVQDAIAPLHDVLEMLNTQLEGADRYLADFAKADSTARRLMTLPGIGPITALAFAAALDDVTRFRGPGQVTSYLGLVPREYSSGEQQRRGAVMRAAHPRVQGLLVQAAWRVWRSTNPQTRALREWARAVARRRGTFVAVVALARRLARLLFAMWRDETDFDPSRIRATHATKAAVATPVGATA
ncbi:MAG TPA: IS110 family transposase [Vicinamibacterales bacterium]|nr:IS110 family transposase [Vicinamibacterales bacterium]